MYLKCLSIILFLNFSFYNLYSQDADKTITITVSGSGKTQEEAKQVALRSAIEQAFGTFISSKTEVLNDKIVSDDIASVANGNIQTYSILNATLLPDKSWGVTVRAIVSVSKLTSFVEAKGVKVEVNGNLFSLNIQQQIINEQNEINSINNLTTLLRQSMLTAFDFSIESGNPKSIDSKNLDWVVPLTIEAKVNSNYEIIRDYILKTFEDLSLNPDEIETYKNLSKAIYPISFNINNNTNTFFLRNEISVKKIKQFASTMHNYSELFTVFCGSQELSSVFNVDANYHEFYDMGNFEDLKIPINFLSQNDIIATFKGNDKKNLSQVEQLKFYEVKPGGKLTHFNFIGLNYYIKVNCFNISSKKFKFKIYNRWGEVVFETSNPFFVKWDGTFKGVKQPLDSYSFYTEYKCNDGELIHEQGTFVLGMQRPLNKEFFD